jgi:hypothetical protein
MAKKVYLPTSSLLSLTLALAPEKIEMHEVLGKLPRMVKENGQLPLERFFVNSYFKVLANMRSVKLISRMVQYDI